jgi:flavin reductase (DIM6/NTAB) family NADH-FMN oxidoreductase RutF
MHFTKESINQLEKEFRTNLINGLSGAKPACLIGSHSSEGIFNLAIFSNIVHLGANPPLIGIICRPLGEQSHTYHNILSEGFFTINHIRSEMIKMAHYTSARFPKNISEFEKSQLTPEFLNHFPAPFVQESSIKIGLKFIEEHKIMANETIVLVGQIEEIFLPEDGIDLEGNILMEKMNGVSVGGLNTYYLLHELEKLPYAKKSDLPKF